MIVGIKLVAAILFIALVQAILVNLIDENNQYRDNILLIIGWMSCVYFNAFRDTVFK